MTSPAFPRATPTAMIVTYGGHGGGKCAAQLREVLDGLGMKPVATMPGFTLPHDRIEANDGIIDPASAFADQLGSLRQGFAELAAAIPPPSATG